jgi:mono/diheme cytochrome c family protein
VVGLSNAQVLAFALIGVGAVLFFAFLAYQSKGRIRPRDLPDIPPSMQPGPSDADLEKPRLEKLQGWGVVFVVLFVIWIPLVWLKEPTQNEDQTKALLQASIERGAQSVQLFSEDNQLGVGCVRCHGDNPVLGGGFNLYNGLRVQVPNLRTVCAGPNVPVHSAIHNIDDVRQTIMRGRTGTDMPSWSVRFQGALDDQQIQDILNYVISIQDKKLVPFKFNVCINPKAKGYVAPTEPAS